MGCYTIQEGNLNRSLSHESGKPHVIDDARVPVHTMVLLLPRRRDIHGIVGTACRWVGIHSDSDEWTLSSVDQVRPIPDDIKYSHSDSVYYGKLQTEDHNLNQFANHKYSLV